MQLPQQATALSRTHLLKSTLLWVAPTATQLQQLTIVPQNENEAECINPEHPFDIQALVQQS